MAAIQSWYLQQPDLINKWLRFRKITHNLERTKYLQETQFRMSTSAKYQFAYYQRRIEQPMFYAISREFKNFHRNF